MLTSLSVIIPAYNEAATIEGVVREALSIGVSVANRLEVLVCDDGSSDRTYDLLRGLAAEDRRVRVLHREANRGIEASIRALCGEARHDYLFFMSADRQWPMDSMVPLARAVERGADLVVGTRRNKRDVYSAYRLIVSHIYERAVRLMGAPVGDPGSIKLGRTACFRVPLASRGVFSDGERLIRASRAGYRVDACDVRFEPRRSGKAFGARPAVVLQAAADLLRVSSSLVVGWPRPSVPAREPGLVVG